MVRSQIKKRITLKLTADDGAQTEEEDNTIRLTNFRYTSGISDFIQIPKLNPFEKCFKIVEIMKILKRWTNRIAFVRRVIMLMFRSTTYSHIGYNFF